MKIGVFGDSYAEKKFQQGPPMIWYQYLAQEGHTIECWGESGSSIYFSAHQIYQKHKEYDLVIWCVTTPGRFSFKNNNGEWHHVTTAWDQYQGTDIETAKKHSVCIDYLKWIFEWESSNFSERCVINQVAQEAANVLLIPCFPPPLSAEFNLYTLCEREAQHWFPNQTIPDIYRTYQDLRAGHISKDNQQILASLISKQLKPGVFKAEYEQFVTPTMQQHEVFTKL